MYGWMDATKNTENGAKSLKLHNKRVITQILVDINLCWDKGHKFVSVR